MSEFFETLLSFTRFTNFAKVGTYVSVFGTAYFISFSMNLRCGYSYHCVRKDSSVSYPFQGSCRQRSFSKHYSNK